MLTAGQTFILGYTNEADNIYRADKHRPVIIFDDFTTANKWVDFDFKVKSSAMKILTLKEMANNASLRYIYFAMQGIKYYPVEHARQWIEKYSTFQIPFPTCVIQKKIAAQLDAFAAVVAALDEEIAARQEQFAGWLEKLMMFDVKEVA